MDNLKVVSLNTRGMRNGVKRRKIFRFFRKHKADIGMLQETHGDSKSEFLWQAENGQKMYFANGRMNAKGVAVVLSKKCSKEVTEVVRDIEGRFLLLKLRHNDHTYCIANIYAPNEDNPLFFENIMEETKKLDCIFTIIGGDFNVVRDAKKDRSVNLVYHPRAKNVIDTWMEDFSDVWRDMHPTEKMFTWMKHRNTPSWSRIDYFLVSSSMKSKCTAATIEPSMCSDHSLITLKINIAETKRGPGSWKFNDELLQDDTFYEQLVQIIWGTKRVYYYMCPEDFWELLKHEISVFCREYSKQLAFKWKQEQFVLYDVLCRMQSELMQEEGWEECLLRNITVVKNQLNAYETQDAKRAAFRCKQKWVAEGEKMSCYYFNMEKRNYISKTMYCIRKQDGMLTKDYTEILNEQHNFYQKLYTSNRNVEFSMVNDTPHKLCAEIKEALEAPVTREELFDSMMTLKSGKCPGADGLSILLYRKFWRELVDPLFHLYESCVEKGQLNPSGRRGLINLIPKKCKDELDLSGWCPITLLNYDYKIWSKMIANRLEVTTELIGKQQTGFIKNRSIFSNIKKVSELVIHYKRTNKPGLIIMIDYEKAFDTLEHNSIKGAFHYFGFGEEFIKMMSLLFTNLELCTVSNGYVSEVLKKERGSNQGCCASPIIFNYCGEIMAHMILNNNSIRGLDIRGIKALLAQFADDTGVFIDYDVLSLNTFVDVMASVEKQLGLKVSYEKTTIYRIGSLCNSNARLFTQKQFKWSNGPVDSLGVQIPCDGEHEPVSFEQTIEKMKLVLNNWKHRRATLFGKVLVINTLMASLFVYKMMSLMNLTKEQVSRIENLWRTFLWGDKKPKIGLDTMKKTREQGGMRLCDIQAKQDGIKIGWIFKLIEEEELLKSCIFYDLSPSLKMEIFHCNLCVKDSEVLFGNDTYWKQMLMAWAKINFHIPKSKADVLNEVLWYNSHIKIGKKTGVLGTLV